MIKSSYCLFRGVLLLYFFCHLANFSKNFKPRGLWCFIYSYCAYVVPKKTYPKICITNVRTFLRHGLNNFSSQKRAKRQGKKAAFGFFLPRRRFFLCLGSRLGYFLKFWPFSFPTRFTSSFDGAAVSDFMVSSCLLVISLERTMSIALSSVRGFSRKGFPFVPLTIIPMTNL